jgi:hypothetical protein
MMTWAGLRWRQYERRMWLYLALPGLAGCRDASSAPVTRDTTVTTAFCRPSDGRIVFGLNVAVRDSATGRRLAADVWAEEGHFAESLMPGLDVPGTNAPASYSGVADRPGRYLVTVIAAGFRLWRRDSIVVRSASGCHVEPVNLTALLQPAA